MQFSGDDPWGGRLSLTVRSIDNGKMSWTFTDVFDDNTLYAEIGETPIANGVANYDIQGKDTEKDDTTFSYQGTIELKDGQVNFTFERGSVSTASPQGGSSSRMAEALKDSGLQNQVTLTKTTDNQ